MNSWLTIVHRRGVRVYRADSSVGILILVFHCAQSSIPVSKLTECSLNREGVHKPLRNALISCSKTQSVLKCPASLILPFEIQDAVLKDKLVFLKAE